MEPAIRYARTVDGVRIAYWTMGDGSPLLLAEIPCGSHLELELRAPGYRAWFDRLCASFRVIRMDLRGGGLSQRDIGAVALGDYVRDIEAVLEAAGVAQAAVFAHDGAGPIAIQLAHDSPERVSHLFLYDTWANGGELPVHARMQELDHLAAIDWPMYTEMIAKVMMELDGPAARQAASFIRRCATAEAWVAAGVATRAFDVRPLLTGLSCQAVVIHSGQNRLSPLEISHELAAAIPGAELHVLNHPKLPVGGIEEVAEIVERAVGLIPLAKRQGALGRGLRTILFTDVEGHTALMDRLGDARGRALLREVERLTRAALRAHGGDEVKSLGDGVMATFLSAHAALECAVELQQALSDSSGTAEDNEELPLRIRVGINAGEPIAENDDYFGQAVIVASRVASLALGGEILVTNVVRELAAGSSLTFADRGAHLLRGLDSPARIWALEWAEKPNA